MYFQNFPTIYYEFEINGVKELRVVKDVTLNVRIRKAILENVTLYDEYDIQEGETPEIIAHKVYGSSLYHWVIMLCNQRFHYVDDFPMESRVLDEYIKDKYERPYDVHHYVNSKGFIVNQDVIGTRPVTNYDHEQAVNETKRRIKLINPTLLNQILRQFKELI